ncbi:MAG: hypothetical protein K6U74_06995, partial [Firmicutes bacterium]|nr:hypothetical protein [Bacillota bacterium]
MGYVWNRYGEIIGKTSGKSYTDYSDKATATYGGGAQASKIWDSGSSSKSTSSGGGTSSLIGKIVPPSSSSSSRSSGGSTYTAPSQPAPSKADALITALKNIGSQWSSASPQGQAELNRQASQLRSEYVKAGGNIADIPTNLWGSDPSRGFQTGADTFAGEPKREAAVLASPQVSSTSSKYSPEYVAALERSVEHSKYFGGVDKYAQAIMQTIQQKGWEGLSDPEAARIMIEGRPDLFGGPLKPGTQPYEEALFRASEQVQKYGNPEKYAQDIMRTVMEKGWKAVSDPVAAQFLIQERPELFNVQSVVVEEPMLDMQEQFAPLFSQLKEIVSQVNYETAPIVTKYYDQIMDMISTTEASIMKRFEEMGQGIDPATQAALASLKETVNKQREYLKEENAYLFRLRKNATWHDGRKL